MPSSPTASRWPIPERADGGRQGRNSPVGCDTGSAALFRAQRRPAGPTVEDDPVCLYLETTNRCNLLCTTCPRTFEALEPPADMSWELFTSIVDQFPRIARVVLHGVGEPMMVRDLPRMIRYLKDRGSYVLFNTNGTLLSPKRGPRAHRCRAGRAAGVAGRGRAQGLRPGPRPRHVRPDRAQPAALQRLCSASGGRRQPKVSLWLTGLKETIGQLPAFVRLAHELGIGEVYLQRLVYFEEGQGLARGQSSLFEQMQESELARSGRRRRWRRISASPSMPPARPSPERA